MNIWYLHPTAGGPGLGRHWRPFWLAHYWREAGHEVTVITASFHHLMEGPARIEGVDSVNGVPYWFVATPEYSGNRFGRLMNMFTLGRRARTTADEIVLACGRPDVIIASSPHIFAVGSAVALARRFRALFWFEVRDLWPESLVALGQAGRFHPLVLWAARLERLAYRNADRLIGLLAGSESYMLQRGLRPGRFVWAPNGVSDSDMASSDLSNPGAAAHDIVRRASRLASEGKFVAVYAGAMGPPQSLEQLMEAFALLQDQGAPVHLIMVGSGVNKAALQKRCTEMGLRNVDISDEVPKAVANELLRSSSVAILSLRASKLWQHGISPNKLFDYCLHAPLTIATCDPSALRGLEDLPVICTPPEQSAELAALLLSLSKQPPPQRREGVVKSLERFRLKKVAADILRDV